MVKQLLFSCSQCGTNFGKWSGQCDTCQAWNTILQEVPLSSGPRNSSIGSARGEIIKFSKLSLLKLLNKINFLIREVNRI